MVEDSVLNDTTRTVWNERALHLLLSLMVPEQVVQYDKESAGLPVDERCRVAARVLMGRVG